MNVLLALTLAAAPVRADVSCFQDALADVRRRAAHAFTAPSPLNDAVSEADVRRLSGLPACPGTTVTPGARDEAIAHNDFLLQSIAQLQYSPRLGSNRGILARDVAAALRITERETIGRVNDVYVGPTGESLERPRPGPFASAGGRIQTKVSGRTVGATANTAVAGAIRDWDKQDPEGVPPSPGAAAPRPASSPGVAGLLTGPAPQRERLPPPDPLHRFDRRVERNEFIYELLQGDLNERFEQYVRKNGGALQEFDRTMKEIKNGGGHCEGLGQCVLLPAVGTVVDVFGAGMFVSADRATLFRQFLDENPDMRALASPQQVQGAEGKENLLWAVGAATAPLPFGRVAKLAQRGAEWVPRAVALQRIGNGLRVMQENMQLARSAGTNEARIAAGLGGELTPGFAFLVQRFDNFMSGLKGMGSRLYTIGQGSIDSGKKMTIAVFDKRFGDKGWNVIDQNLVTRTNVRANETAMTTESLKKALWDIQPQLEAYVNQLKTLLESTLKESKLALDEVSIVANKGTKPPAEQLHVDADWITVTVAWDATGAAPSVGTRFMAEKAQAAAGEIAVFSSAAREMETGAASAVHAATKSEADRVLLRVRFRNPAMKRPSDEARELKSLYDEFLDRKYAATPALR